MLVGNLAIAVYALIHSPTAGGGEEHWSTLVAIVALAAGSAPTSCTLWARSYRRDRR